MSVWFLHCVGRLVCLFRHRVVCLVYLVSEQRGASCLSGFGTMWSALSVGFLVEVVHLAYLVSESGVHPPRLPGFRRSGPSCMVPV